ncbi:MAG: hypothetical protein H0T49_02780 [Chloroflexia bacterium]|jgi:hypothetical protein|nr:hypothetical protein [Chloroflexia bacterium]
MPEFFQFDNRLLWLLIGLCVAMVLTLQAVETAVEGAWPHHRRPARLTPRARPAYRAWSIVALLVLPGGLLAILNVAVLLWRDTGKTESQVLGSLFLGVGWVIFLLFSVNTVRFGHYLANLGLAGPLALIAILLLGDVLLLIGLFAVLPSWQTVREAVPVI